jgi:S1-C subfamily serine protease
MKRTVIALSVLALTLSACSSSSSPPTSPPATRVSSAAPASPDAVNVETPALSPVDPSKDPVVQVVERVRPAVVNVTTDLLQSDPFGAAQTGRGVGTGFVVRSDGIVVTNYHVVEGASRITVISSDAQPKRYEARVIGGDQQADLAVLKIDAQGLATAPLGSSAALKLGQPVVALGYALAIKKGGPTVTTGIVSALGRSIKAADPGCQTCTNGQRLYTDIIQTDAAINPGNSGGPLVNLAGQVIGINTAGAGAAAAENIGFAIAIDSATPTIEDAMANPSGPVAYLGVSSVDVDPGVALQFNLPVKAGAYVGAVSPDGPAEKAGIKVGDVIVSLDGNTVDSSAQLRDRIRVHKPGDQVDVTVVHGDGTRDTFHITLGVNPLP